MLSSDLAAKVQEYLDNHISLEELSDWLAPRIPFYLEHHPSEDSDLVGTVELGRAEMDDEIANEADLRQSLAEALQGTHLLQSSISFVAQREATIVAGSVNTTLEQAYVVTLPSAIQILQRDVVYS